MTDSTANILALSDAGMHPGDIMHKTGLSSSRVYGVLRVERPDRSRKPREGTSDLPRKIRGLAGRGIKQARIAFLLNVSRQYVSRVIQEAAE